MTAENTTSGVTAAVSAGLHEVGYAADSDKITHQETIGSADLPWT